MAVRVTVWHEFRHEKRNPKVAEIYPDGIHEAIASHLRKAGDLEVRTATLDEEEHGLTEEVLKNTDVLTWWGHMAHGEAQDLIVERVHRRVLHGMGLVVLHSGHFSKIFRKLMGTTCDLKWREVRNEREVLWVTRPGHPIVAGIDDHFVLPQEEMYGEYFDIPEPECTFLISSFSGGEVFRSGCTWTRVRARSSTSAPATKRSRRITTRTCSASSKTPAAGPPPPRGASNTLSEIRSWAGLTKMRRSNARTDRNARAYLRVIPFRWNATSIFRSASVCAPRVATAICSTGNLGVRSM